MRDKKILMPNHIVVKDGLACGDKITLLYDFDKEFIHFQFVPEGCSYCNKMCELLQNRYEYKYYDWVIKECDRLLECVPNNEVFFEQVIGLPYMISREECCLAPIRILRDCAADSLQRIESNEKINLYTDRMDCDACAIRENVSWLYQKPTHVHGQYHVSAKKREQLMKLAKISLKGIDIEQVKWLYETLDDNDFKFMEEYKLFPMIYQNLSKLGVLRNDDSRWRLLIYQRQRTVIAYKEYAAINELIIKNRYKAFWVKGAFSYQLYKEKMMRNLTDFDLLAIDEDDAFSIISWLLKKDFRIFPDSFSLKSTMQNGNYVYTGHLHFQKIINLQFRMIVDINFTGFPMIRVASYIPKYLDGQIKLESMIIITVCHLFKHKEIFMKDINDLYLMLINNQMKSENLLCELVENGLEDLFAVVLNFIVKEYEIPNDAKEFQKIVNIFSKKKIICGNWPYDAEDAYAVKNRLFKNYAQNVIESERIYLYPLLIFGELSVVDSIDAELMKKYEFGIIAKEGLTKNIIRYKISDYYFVLTPVGWFLQMMEYYTEKMKEGIRQIVEKLCLLSGAKYIDIPYAIEFEENWLDE